MLFVKPLTISANTASTSPFSEVLVCSPGKVIGVEMLFPPGCVGLVGVRVKEFERVIWPTNPDEWIIADGETVEWQEDHDMIGAPWALTLEGYNDDDTFDHTIYFRFAMLEVGKISLANKFWDWVRGW